MIIVMLEGVKRFETADESRWLFVNKTKKSDTTLSIVDQLHEVSTILWQIGKKSNRKHLLFVFKTCYELQTKNGEKPETKRDELSNQQ